MARYTLSSRLGRVDANSVLAALKLPAEAVVRAIGPALRPLTRSSSRASQATRRNALSRGRRWATWRMVLRMLFVVLALPASDADAENRILTRGNYYREASTRVLAPELRFTVDVPDDRLTLGAGYLLDVVSSASIATGTADATGGDNVFTELRHETSGTVSSRLDAWQFGGSFRYTTETDYVGRSISTGFGRDFLQRTLHLGLTYAYNFDNVYRIFGGGGRRLPWCGGVYGRNCDRVEGGTNRLQTHYLALSYAHAVHPTVLLLASAEAAFVDGPQDNPYRGMLIPAAEQESHPLRRIRFAFWTGPRWHIRRAKVTLEPNYRFSADDWGVLTHAVEAQIHWRVHPHVRLRFRYRFYTQTEAFFFDASYSYAYDESAFCTRATPEGCASADPKLSSFVSHTPGLQLTWELDGIARRTKMAWLERGWVEATYNYLYQTSRFGPARVLGSLAFSLAF